MPRDKNGYYKCARMPHGVGKILGQNKWFHITALDVMPENEQTHVQKAVEAIGGQLPDWDDTMVKINFQEDLCTFSECVNWNTDTEPPLGRVIGVKGVNVQGLPEIYELKPPRDVYIYHHKWMFVKDDFPGFDLKFAMQWSEIWENHPVTLALMAKKDEHFRLRIGKQSYWYEQIQSKIEQWLEFQGKGAGPGATKTAVPTQSFENFVNNTYIDRGDMTKRNIIPKFMQLFTEPGVHTVLDFGAGKDGYHTKQLREKGFDVTAYDCGDNFDAAIHDKDALQRQYDVVLGSNVLNVQPCRETLQTTLEQIYGAVKPGGVFFCNYPQPRKCQPAMSNGELTKILQNKFEKVLVLENGTWIWKCWKIKRLNIR